MMRIAPLVLFLVALLAGCSSNPPVLVSGHVEPAEVLVIENVRVFAGETTETVEGQDVWVQAGKIKWIGNSGSRTTPEHARRVTGEGRTLLPGLIDMHTHAGGIGAPPWKAAFPNPEYNLEGFLYAGITTIVDLGGALDESSDLRTALERRELAGPRMLFAGPHFTAKDGHPVAMLRMFLPWPLPWFVEDDMGAQLDSVADVNEAFEAYEEAEADIIKLTSDQIPLGIPTLSGDVAKAVVERAHANGLKAVAHIGSESDVIKMADAGVDALVHGVYRDRISMATAKRLADEGIAVAPTLFVFENLARLDSRSLEMSVMQRSVGVPELVQAIDAGPGDYEQPEKFRGWLDAVQEFREAKYENVRLMKEAGVKILAGSDSPNVALFAGALHEELGELVKAGLTPAEAIRAATYENAAFLGLTPEIGVVREGATADLLLVEGDPTADITAIHRIAAVFQNGQEVVRSPRLR